MALISTAFASLAMSQIVTTTVPRVPQSESARRDACIEKIETDPEEAYEDGLAWSFEGNRPGARHCTALALVALGQEEEGATRLELLANAEDGGSVYQRALYLAQAGSAWILASAPDAAVVALTNSLKLQPDNPETLKDRATAHFLTGSNYLAITDLNAVVGLFPNDDEALRMRSQVHLARDNFGAAEADILAAMAIDGTNIDTLLLRGELNEARRLHSPSSN